MLFNVNHYHHQGDEVPPWAKDLRGLVLSTWREIMSAIDDLKAAIADLATELSDNNAEIEALLGKITAPGTSDADIAAAVSSIRELIATNKAEVDKAKATVV